MYWRRKIKLVCSNFVWICVASYFLFHLFSGARGAISWARLSIELSKLEDELSSLKTTNGKLENKISLLRDDHLDLDILQEQAMNVLGYVGENDVVVLLPKDAAAAAASGN